MASEAVVGKATYTADLDRAPLDKELAAANADISKSGAAAEKAFSGTATTAVSKWGTALKVAGATGAVAFGGLAAAALQAQRAQGEYMAATGASREQAKQFVRDMDALAGSAGTVGRSFEDISKVGTQVSQQWQIQGDKARDLTENVLEYSKVTKSDGVAATNALEDALSAFGLGADDAAGFMDKLVLSSQKYGTDAGPATVGVLQSMAPALQAMGADLDDGIGLLNLFETAGLDASAAQAGLKKAIAQLKPGQDLDDLIAQVGSIEDPLLRAQEAARLFGAKAGAGLANAIKPGQDSLADFKVDAQEADGALHTAANNMLTDSDKIRGVFDKILAGARDVGQEFGPALTGLAGLASLATPLLRGLGGVLSKVKGPLLASAATIGGEFAEHVFGTSTLTEGLRKAWEGAERAAESVLKPIITKAGLVAGEVYAVAIEVGHKIIHGLSAIWEEAMANPLIHSAVTKAGAIAGGVYGLAAEAAAKIAEVIGKAWAAIGSPGSAVLVAASGSGTAAGGAFVLGLGLGLPLLISALAPSIRDALEGALGVKKGNDGWLAGTIVDSILDFLSPDKASALFANRMQPAGTAIVQGVADGVTAAAPVIMPTAMGAIPGAATAGVSQWAPAFANLGKTAAAEVGTGILSSADAVADDMRETAVFAARAAETDAVNAAHALGVETTDALGKGINSSEATSSLFNQIDQLKDALEKYLSPRQQAIKLIGGKYIDTLIDGMQSKDHNLQLASQDLAIGAIATIEAAGLQGKKGQKGLKDIGILYDQLLASGMTAEQIATKLKAAGVADTVIAGLTGQTQLNSARTGGGNIASAWVTGLVKELGSNATASQISAAVRSSMGQLHGDSPPKWGPLRNIDKWGTNVGAAWVDGFLEPFAAVGQRAAGAVNMSGLQPLLASGSASIEVRHVVALDLRNAPAGITNADVARMVQPVLDFDAAWQAKIDQAQQATGMRWTQVTR